MGAGEKEEQTKKQINFKANRKNQGNWIIYESHQKQIIGIVLQRAKHRLQTQWSENRGHDGRLSHECNQIIIYRFQPFWSRNSLPESKQQAIHQEQPEYRISAWIWSARTKIVRWYKTDETYPWSRTKSKDKKCLPSHPRNLIKSN